MAQDFSVQGIRVGDLGTAVFFCKGAAEVEFVAADGQITALPKLPESLLELTKPSLRQAAWKKLVAVV